jgi:hypothetical protein
MGGQPMGMKPPGPGGQMPGPTSPVPGQAQMPQDPVQQKLQAYEQRIAQLERMLVGGAPNLKPVGGQGGIKPMSQPSQNVYNRFTRG